jgi:hypothetical protein
MLDKRERQRIISNGDVLFEGGFVGILVQNVGFIVFSSPVPVSVKRGTWQRVTHLVAMKSIREAMVHELPDSHKAAI